LAKALYMVLEISKRMDKPTFFFKIEYRRHGRSHTHMWTHSKHTQPYPGRLNQHILKLTKSPRTPCYRFARHLPLKEVYLLNVEINLEKYEHPCLVEDLNPEGIN
jgi:hypothetical protein